ncbi:MAG: hypothetical protein ACFNS7_07985, partial [Capnocytophaga granulosa]
DVPGAFLFTTNCIMPPKENYKANIFTTDMVGFDGCAHIEEKEAKSSFLSSFALKGARY